MNFVIFLLNFDEIFFIQENRKELSEFHAKFQEITKVLNILRNRARKIRKMLEISGICEKFHFSNESFIHLLRNKPQTASRLEPQARNAAHPRLYQDRDLRLTAQFSG